MRESLLEPDRSIAPAYRQLRVITKSGVTHRGILLSEDEYTLHLMDAGEQIRSLYKSDLSAVDRLRESFMPSYRAALTPRETDDLLSYLCTLRGNRQ